MCDIILNVFILLFVFHYACYWHVEKALISYVNFLFYYFAESVYSVQAFYGGSILLRLSPFQAEPGSLRKRQSEYTKEEILDM